MAIKKAETLVRSVRLFKLTIEILKKNPPHHLSDRMRRRAGGLIGIKNECDRLVVPIDQRISL